MPGESADDVARRAREKAERLLRHAEAYEKGAEGERAVGKALATLPPEWTAFHDVHWPGRTRANIDHLVIGPGGVFVIDAKNWSGSITLRDGTLRQNGYSRRPAVDGARAAAQAVAALVPSLPSEAFVPVLCFAGDSGVDAHLDGVLTCHVTSLVALLRSRRAVLSQDWLNFLRFELDMSTRAATGPQPAILPLPALPAPTYRSGPAARPSRRRVPRGLRRTASGLVIWWVTCGAAYSTVGSATHFDPAVLFSTYGALALGSAAVVTRAIKK